MLLSDSFVIQPQDKRTSTTSHRQNKTRSFLHSLATFTAQKHGLFLALRRCVQDTVAWPGPGSASYAIWHKKAGGRTGA